MRKSGLQRTLQILLFLFLVFAGLYYAKPFLVPVCFAGLFAMLFLPLSRWFESKGINKALASICCILILVIVISGVIALISYQVTDLISDLGNIEQKIKTVVTQIENTIAKTFGISRQQQEEVIQEQSKNANGLISSLVPALMGILIDFVLMLVYIFLFMYSRSHLKKFILMLVPKNDTGNTEEAINNIEKVTQQYLTGLGLMIVCLWIMYGIGFSIAGLKNAFFFAILCGILEIVPFAGNLTGNTLAVLMAITQGGGSSMVIIIIVIYALVQFIQTYLLEPLAVGANVNINPLFTIIALVIGELVWGIAGMVLAIPLLAIIKIICDHIESLHPYGFLIGSVKQKKSGLFKRGRDK
jgi:predicted PurR-regulated permease PerM